MNVWTRSQICLSLCISYCIGLKISEVYYKVVLTIIRHVCRPIRCVLVPAYIIPLYLRILSCTVCIHINLLEFKSLFVSYWCFKTDKWNIYSIVYFNIGWRLQFSTWLVSMGYSSHFNLTQCFKDQLFISRHAILYQCHCIITFLLTLSRNNFILDIIFRKLLIIF